MDNLEDRSEGDTNSAGESHQGSPDPMVQARDDSNRSGERVQPTEIIYSAKKPISDADVALLPNQSMGMGEPTEPGLSVTDIIVWMFRFKWMILTVFVLVAGPMIAAIWTQVVPKYQASAEVRVRPIIPYLVFRTEESGKIHLYDSFVNTQVSIIRNPTVLQRVLDQQDIQQTQWYKNPPKSLMSRLRGYPPTPINRLRDALSARPRKGTEIIDVAFVDANAKDALLIVNTVLDHYVRYIGEMSDATEDKLYGQLVDQYKSLENEIQGRETVAAKLRQTLGTAMPQELISGQRVRLDETQARLAELRQNITLLEWEMKRAVTDDSNGVPAPIADKIHKQPKYHEDEEWRRLDANVRTIRHNIAASSFTPLHPDAARAEKELKFAEESLRLREEQLNEQWRDQLNNPAKASIPIAEASGLSYEEGLIYLEHQLARSKLEEQLLADELKKQQAEFVSLFESAQLLDKENNALSHKRDLFGAVRDRLDQKNMERNVPGSIEVLTRARVPSQPYNDRRIAFTAMALVLALGAGGGLAYLRANKTQAIYTPRDMPYPMQVPFLGYIPLAPDAGSSGNEIGPAAIESIRIVRTALLSRLNGEHCTTVLVTSASEGTGKSTFTIMLGKSLARSGKKVLLIDADFQKKTLTKRFGLYEESGFIQSLRCWPIQKQHVFPTDTSGLSIMPVGKQGEDDVELEAIADGAFNIFVDKLRKKYNIILLDSPPVLTLADTTILSSQVDGTIMVERKFVSRRANVISALARLSSAGGRLLGTVFIGSHE